MLRGLCDKCSAITKSHLSTVSMRNSNLSNSATALGAVRRLDTLYGCDEDAERLKIMQIYILVTIWFAGIAITGIALLFEDYSDYVAIGMAWVGQYSGNFGMIFYEIKRIRSDDRKKEIVQSSPFHPALQLQQALQLT